MIHSIFPSHTLFLATLLLLLLVLFPSTIRGVDVRFSSCSSSFQCGKFSYIGYPFWRNGQPDYCGHPGFKLEDCKQENITITILSQKYHVLDINRDTQILKIARMDFSQTICPDRFFNTSMDSGLFSYTLNDENATIFYNCTSTSDHNPRSKDHFSCPVDKIPRRAYFVSPNTSLGNEEFRRSSCNISVVIPVMKMAVKEFVNHGLSAGEVINQGFEVKWNMGANQCWSCLKTGGKCGFNSTLNQFRCFCGDGDHESFCPPQLPVVPASQSDMPGSLPGMYFLP